MILLAILILILIAVAIIVTTVAGVIGAGFMALFGDLIVFTIIVILVIRFIKRNKNND